MDISNLDYYEIVFPNLNIDVTVKSTAFEIFGISIQWYGIIIVIGMILAMLFAFSQMKSYGLDSNRAVDAIIGGIIGGIVGARLYYVVFRWDIYSQDLKSILDIRSGGLAIYGGILGSIATAIVIAKIRKVKILPLLDLAGMGFLIGQGIGRWGNFTNHEAFGSNTDGLFGMTSGKIQSLISSSGVEGLSPDIPVHPCFFYESVWCLTGFVVLFIVSKKFRKFDGQIFIMYAGWYGLGRFFIEGLRTDSLTIGNLKVSQILAILCFIASVILLIVIGSKVKRMGSDYVLYRDTPESKKLLAEALEADRIYAEKKTRKKKSSKNK